jgi:hypothetical protein
MATNTIGQLLANVSVSVRVKIYQGWDYTTPIWTENFTNVQSNGFGLIQVTLGSNNPVAFSGIYPATNLEMWVEVNDGSLWNTVGVYNITNTVLDIYKSGLGFTIEPGEIIMQDGGSILTSNATGKGTELKIGVAGTFLASNGTVPTWLNPAPVIYPLFSATAPLVYNGSGNYSIPVATNIANGYLSSADWNSFTTGIQNNAQGLAQEILDRKSDVNDEEIARKAADLLLQNAINDHTSADLDLIVGNEISNVTNSSLTRTGLGTTASPYTVAINTANSNSWGATQNFPATAEQGNVFVNSINSATTPINGVRVDPDFGAQTVSTTSDIAAGSVIVIADPGNSDGTIFADGTITSASGFVGNVTGNVTGNLTGNVTGNVSGNAGTVTNGVYTSGSYNDPAWLTHLNYTKLTNVPATFPPAAHTHNGSDITNGTLAYSKIVNASAPGKILVSQVGNTWAEANLSDYDKVNMTTNLRVPRWNAGTSKLIDGQIVDDAPNSAIYFGTAAPQVTITTDNGNLYVDGDLYTSDASIISTPTITSDATPGAGTSLTIDDDVVINGKASQAAAPTIGNNLTNKTYVDGAIAAIVETDPVFVASAAHSITDAGSGAVITVAERTKLNGIAAGAEVNVQANWTEANNAADDYILNKPTLGTIASHNTGEFQAYDADLTTLSGFPVAGNENKFVRVNATGDGYVLSDVPSTLDDAYVNGNDISTDVANGNVIISGTEKLQITTAGGLGVTNTITTLQNATANAPLLQVLNTKVDYSDIMIQAENSGDGMAAYFENSKATTIDPTVSINHANSLANALEVNGNTKMTGNLVVDGQINMDYAGVNEGAINLLGTNPANNDYLLVVESRATNIGAAAKFIIDDNDVLNPNPNDGYAVGIQTDASGANSSALDVQCGDGTAKGIVIQGNNSAIVAEVSSNTNPAVVIANDGTGLAMSIDDGAVKYAYSSAGAIAVPTDVTIYHFTGAGASALTLPAVNASQNGRVIYISSVNAITANAVAIAAGAIKTFIVIEGVWVAVN